MNGLVLDALLAEAAPDHGADEAALHEAADCARQFRAKFGAPLDLAPRAV